MREAYSTHESPQWRQARQAAFVQDVLAALTRRSVDLMSFENLHQKLRLSNLQYLDLQEISLDLIVGSVGRYTDFTRTFLPRQDHLRERWQRIEELVATGRELPPIELYKVGQVYFVRDGNHRVSVARQHGRSVLKACVWEYETEIPLEPGADIDDLLCGTAHAGFLQSTRIDQLCPGAQIRLTQPGGYEDLLAEIQAHQQIFSRMDRRDIDSDEALTLWYEIRYMPIVDIIRRSGVLHHFPGRTETDLYLWLCQNLQELEANYERHFSGPEAARDLSKRFGRKRISARTIRHAIVMSATVTALSLSDWWRASRRRLRRKPGRRPEG